MIKKIVFIELAMVSSLLAGPPMLSDDPFVPDYKTFEINIASELEKTDETTITVPVLDVNYGILPHLQITVETGYAHGQNTQDVTAVQVGVKYHFYRSENINLSIYPQYSSFPIKTVFDEGENFTLAFPIQFELSPNLALIAMPSYVYSKDEGKHVELGSFLQYTHKKHSYYLEAYMEEKKNLDDLMLLNVGYFYQWEKDLGLMASVGKELVSTQEKATISYVGMKVLF